MSLQTRLLNLVDVLLRVPPLFIIDELFRIGLGFPVNLDGASEANTTGFLNLDSHIASRVYNLSNQYDTQFYEVLLLIVVKFLLALCGCLAALCTFMLLTKHLLVVYMYLISVGVVFISYWSNVNTVKAVLSADTGDRSILDELLSLDFDSLLKDGVGMALFENYIAQIVLSCIFSFIHLGPKYPSLQKVWPISFLAPSFLCLLPLSPNILHHSPVFAAVLPLAMVKFILWSSAFTVIQTIYGGYLHAKDFISNFGLSALMETEWMRLNVPCVLRTFWILRLAEHALALHSQLGLDPSSLFLACKALLISGCETLTAVLGMTSLVSYLCHYIGSFFQWVLLAEDEEDKSIGTVSAILFYILALQTGLTGLEPEKRFIRLCRNFCLLFTALLHFIHNIVNPLLMSLSASHNPSLHRHVRALLVCCFLIVYPVSLLIYLWAHHPMSTWLLAVSAFSVEVIVKVIVSLLIYGLFLLDAYRSTFWEKLDDYVYYIRAFGNTVEFCFGIFLFFNGAWILLFESGGAIRAGMMGVHAYFNIWCEARAGWSVFMKRRTAVNKIESLPEASEAQLATLDDVCAICYQEMRSAKITRCSHYFHGVCLRKWLYVQDRCPLCHDILYKVESEKDSKSSSTHFDSEEEEEMPR